MQVGGITDERLFEEDDKVTKVVIKPGDNVVIEDDGTIIVYPTEVESEG